jgi:hypothetical protein
MEDLADQARLEHFFQLYHRRLEPVLGHDRELGAAGLGGGPHRVAFFEAGRHRFLDQHMLAGPEQRHAGRGMFEGRQANGGQVKFRPLQQLLVVAENGRLEAILGRFFPGFLRKQVNQGDDLALRPVFEISLNMAVRDGSGTEDGDLVHGT